MLYVILGIIIYMILAGAMASVLDEKTRTSLPIKFMMSILWPLGIFYMLGSTLTTKIMK
jgi:hypothetical protein